MERWIIDLAMVINQFQINSVSRSKGLSCHQSGAMRWRLEETSSHQVFRRKACLLNGMHVFRHFAFKRARGAIPQPNVKFRKPFYRFTSSSPARSVPA